MYIGGEQQKLALEKQHQKINTFKKCVYTGVHKTTNDNLGEEVKCGNKETFY